MQLDSETVITGEPPWSWQKEVDHWAEEAEDGQAEDDQAEEATVTRPPEPYRSPLWTR